MANIIPTVGVLVYRNGEVLLVQHGAKASHLHGVYGLPAGKLEAGESEEEAAVRELFEETGLKTAADSH
ncbi:MAG TPA: NUDIX domain-containing protein [Candidatus Nanoarchaeia archaeon]|nr:NUDIX domain-containing protein [Candidatus Nanoarchaeia archaeon]